MLFSGVFAPADAPEWARDRERLWNRAEAAEKRKDAQTARSLDIALPHELTPEQARFALQDFIRESFTRRGYVVDANIHGPEPGGDQRNIHAHLLVTMRTLDGNGFAATKDRSQNGKEALNQWRGRWAQTAARHLERHGFRQEAERMSYAHLPLEDQQRIALEKGDRDHAEALIRAPTQHLGPTATRMERDGRPSARGESNRGGVQETER